MPDHITSTNYMLSWPSFLQKQDTLQDGTRLFKQDDNWGVIPILAMGTEGIKPAVTSAAKEAVTDWKTTQSDAAKRTLFSASIFYSCR